MDDLFIEREPGEPFYKTTKKWRKRQDEMLRLRESGLTYAKIGDMAGISVTAARRLVGFAHRRKIRKNEITGDITTKA